MLNQDDIGVKEWLHSMIKPFDGGKRMPNPVPINSCLYSDKALTQVTIGSGQDFVMLFNPQILSFSSQLAYKQVYIAARNVSLGSDYTGLNWGSHVVGTPANYATQYMYPANAAVSPIWTYSSQVRLSSAGVKVRYIGSELNRAGMFRFGNTKQVNISTALVPSPSQFNELMDSDAASAEEGVYQFWLPIDIAAFEFQNTDVIDTSSFLLYGYGFPTGMVIDIEFVFNYEYIPTLQYHELLNSNSAPTPIASTSDIGKYVQHVSSVSKGAMPLTKSKSGFLDTLWSVIKGVGSVAANVLGGPVGGGLFNVATGMLGSLGSYRQTNPMLPASRGRLMLM